MPVFNDTFTEAVQVNLEDHTPDTGTGWTKLWGTDTAIFFFIDPTNDVTAPTDELNKGCIYTADATYPSANYSVEADCNLDTYPKVVYLLARVQDQENMYAVRFASRSLNGQLMKKVSGEWTYLGDSITLSNGNLKLEVNETTIKVYDDDIQIISVTDTDITAAGKAGIAAGGGAELEDSTNDGSSVNTFDNFTVTDLGGSEVATEINPLYIKSLN